MIRIPYASFQWFNETIFDLNHKTVAWNDHNVYVLGAGFSKDAGLPLVAEFFNRTRDSVQWLKDNGQHAGNRRGSASYLAIRCQL